MRVENDTVTLHQGGIVTLDKHVPHSVYPTSENDLGINIISSGDYFPRKFINHLPHD